MRAVAAAIALVLAFAGVARAQPAPVTPPVIHTIDAPESGTLEFGGPEPPIAIVLTFGVGAPIFEKWGHAALCLDYPHSGREPICFNWGTTDFTDGGQLVWGFLRGQQLFWIEPQRMSLMLAFYEDEDRDIYEQRIPLSPDAARALEAGVLAQLYGPGRFYVYDHFADNCTTRIRDLVDGATGGKLHAQTTRAFPLTLRQMGERGLVELPLLRGLEEFVVGRAIDQPIDAWRAMFSPDVLREELAAELGATPVAVYQRAGHAYPSGSPGAADGRWQLGLAAAVFVLPLALARWRRRFERATLAWATVWLGGWGVALWALALLSAIPGLRYNEAALVFVPFDIALPFLGAAQRRRYAAVRVAGLALVSLACATGLFAQPLWVPIATAIVPLVSLAV